MNRAIKFRAYLTDSESITYSNGNHMEYDVTIVDGKYADVESGWDIHGTYDYPLMQFTGLFDCVKKEIWEGDIVLMPDKSIRIVSFLEPEFMLQKRINDKVDVDRFSAPIALEKVIGNIYENPELLSV